MERVIYMFFSLFGLITKYFTLMTLNYKNFEMTTPPPHYPVDFPFVWQGPVPKSILSSDTANLGNLTPMLAPPLHGRHF